MDVSRGVSGMSVDTPISETQLHSSVFGRSEKRKKIVRRTRRVEKRSKRKGKKKIKV
jgi:hypothetical protein